MKLERFKGNCPAVVNKDAKYRIVSENGEFVVGIEYRTDFGEIWSPTDKKHIKLVEMVNSVKVEAQSIPGGQFYINEYRQVIVPTKKGYFYAGEYHEDLIFSFEGKRISGNGTDLEGKPLSIGDEWIGTHAGIPYILNAGGADISFEVQVRPKVKLKKVLSKEAGIERAAKLANRISGVIGHFQGGRFYINEFRQMFKPLNSEYGIKYIYLGALNHDDPWFKKDTYGKPHASEKKISGIDDIKNIEKSPLVNNHSTLKQESNVADIFKIIGIS